MIVKTKYLFTALLFVVACIGKAQKDSAMLPLVRSISSYTNYEERTDRIQSINDSLRRADKQKERYYFLKNSVDHLLKTDPLSCAYTCIQLGNFYNTVGKYDQAISSFNTAKSIIEDPKYNINGSDNALNLLHLVYLNTGNSYYFMSYFDRSLEYYLKALSELKKKKVQDESNDRRLAIIFNNLGIAYNIQKNLTSSSFYFNQALKLDIKLRDSSKIADVLCNLARVQETNNRLDSAMKLLMIAKEIYVKSGDIYDMIYIHNMIADNLLKQKRTAEAFEYVSFSLSRSDTNDYNFNLLNTYKILTAIYNLKKDIKNEFKFYKLFKTCLDSSNKDVALNEINSKTMEMEFAKLHLTDSIISANNIKTRDLKIEQGKQQKYYLIVILMAVILGLWQVYNRYKTSQKQNKIIAEQKNLVDLKNREIIESINYAKRLQDAILPTNEKLKDILSDHFVIYLPKDIVAGDFYWAHSIQQDHPADQVLIAAADCTGHGVPGAMMSIACNNALNRTVDELQVYATGNILDVTREMIIENFNKNNAEIRDGMDISLLSVNNKKQVVEWSGANNRLLYLSGEELIEIKADKQPIGNYEKKSPFKTHQIPYKKGDIFYLLTDGFIDQFGGPKNKKFGISNLKELIATHGNKPLAQQKQIFEETFHSWRSAVEQIDDVTVLAIKI